MKKIFIFFALLAITSSAMAQNTFTATVIDSATRSPLIGASVKFPALKKGASSNVNGRVSFVDIPSGTHLVEVKYIGYETLSYSLTFPINQSEAFNFLLKENHGEALDEVLISTTRTSRTIANIPTRIEVIAEEELDEKANMKPGDIRLLLTESTGIQTQQTSATSANASIRIQGLDGRYTQILKDGFPLYAGAASGLGLLQIPPLDLKQVEVIKGSASTLYGGGAIAGLVNLISKTPKKERELSLHLNGTSAGGLDLNGFFSQRFGKAGITVFASRNSNKPYDPADIDLTAIPEFERYTFNPKLYLYFTERTTLNFGLNTSFEDRTGGDIHYIKGNADASHNYFERNESSRLSSQFALRHQFNSNSEINIRNSVSYFNRQIDIPTYGFEGVQYGTFSEVNYIHHNEKTEWIGGINLWTDSFREGQQTSVPLRDYNQTTIGAFLQNNLHATHWLEIETGLRGDYVLDYGFALLPRVSALVKFSEKLNSRLGGGLGYKTPSIFTEESERIQYQEVLPIFSENNKLEKSVGVNLDVNYKTSFNDEVSFSVNNLFFYTALYNPLSMERTTGNVYEFKNLSGHIDSKGMETNIKLGYRDFKLLLGYTFTDTKIHTDATLRTNPLTAKHRLNNILFYEVEDKWKIGAEAYYYSKQKLNDETEGEPFWILGFMAEKLWARFSLYINFENFTDTRQTRFESIYTGNISNPVFRDIYAPLDGFVVNGGIKLRL